MVILDLWGIRFHPAVVVGLGNDLLFNSILAHCEDLNFVDFKSFFYLFRKLPILEGSGSNQSFDSCWFLSLLAQYTQGDMPQFFPKITNPVLNLNFL